VCDGAYGKGSVFELTPAGGGTWTYSSLHDFTGDSDGAYTESAAQPGAGLAQAFDIGSLGRYSFEALLLAGLNSATIRRTS
jgi:hypothetical protein